MKLTRKRLGWERGEELLKNSIFMKVLEDGRLVNRAVSGSVQDWIMKDLLRHAEKFGLYP